jgi:hypothetical protein
MQQGENTEQTNSTEQNNNENPSQQCNCTASSCCRPCLPKCIGKFIWKTISESMYQLFCKSIITRLLSSIVPFTTAILWFGFVLNFTRDVIFLPFSHSPDAQTFKRTAWIYAAVPGIMHFSAHYFWFLTQFAFHCYRKEEIPGREPPRAMRKKYHLLSRIDVLVDVYRVMNFLFLLLLAYSRLMLGTDSVDIILVPIGVSPILLDVMWDFFHIYGVYMFCQHSFSFSDNVNSDNDIENSRNDIIAVNEENSRNENIAVIEENNTNDNTAVNEENNKNDNVQVRDAPSPNYPGSVAPEPGHSQDSPEQTGFGAYLVQLNESETMVVVRLFSCLMMIFSCLDQYSPYHWELVWYAILFTVYRLLFMNFSIEENRNENATFDGNYSIKGLIRSFMCHSDKIKKLFTVFSKSSEHVQRNQQFYQYKFFVMVVLRLLLTTINFVINDMHSRRFTFVYLLVYGMFIFFWIPPIFSTIQNNEIIKWQMSFIKLLLIFMFAMPYFTILYMYHTVDIVVVSAPDPLDYISSTTVSLVIYCGIMLNYHIRHFFRNAPVEMFHLSGVILWKEKHDKITIVVHTYNYMYFFLIL